MNAHRGGGERFASLPSGEGKEEARIASTLSEIIHIPKSLRRKFGKKAIDFRSIAGFSSSLSGRRCRGAGPAKVEAEKGKEEQGKHDNVKSEETLNSDLGYVWSAPQHVGDRGPTNGIATGISSPTLVAK